MSDPTCWRVGHRALRIVVSLTVENLSKNFGPRKIFRNLSFSVSSQGSLGVTGRNGSGKTTLMKIISHLIEPTSGAILLKSDDKVVKTEEALGYLKMVSPEMALYEMLTAYENLSFFAAVSGTRLSPNKRDELLELVGLQGRGDDRVHAYSSGMKQRLKYAVALLGEPEVLLLDEPNSNLDEAGRKTVVEIMKRQQQNKILIIATNEPEDLQNVQQVINLD